MTLILKFFFYMKWDYQHYSDLLNAKRMYEEVYITDISLALYDLGNMFWVSLPLQYFALILEYYF